MPAGLPAFFGRRVAFARAAWYNVGMEYCISDIHGYYDLFCRLLDKIGFCAADKLYVLGDIIDKGPDSIRLAKLLFSMPNVVCVAGNHEYDFLKYYGGLAAREGSGRAFEEARAYFSDGALLDGETLARFDELPFYVETDAFIGVHAGVPVRGGVPLHPGEASAEQLVYNRQFKEPSVLPEGGKCILFGHTPARYVAGRDEILLYPRRGAAGRGIGAYCKVHLDTGVYLSGVLGCIALETCRCTYVEK